jgi:hypothetical protein
LLRLLGYLTLLEILFVLSLTKEEYGLFIYLCGGHGQYSSFSFVNRPWYWF